MDAAVRAPALCRGEAEPVPTTAPAADPVLGTVREAATGLPGHTIYSTADPWGRREPSARPRASSQSAGTNRIGTDRVPHSAQRAIRISPLTEKSEVRANSSSSVVRSIIRASGAPGQAWIPAPNGIASRRFGRSSTNSSPFRCPLRQGPFEVLLRDRHPVQRRLGRDAEIQSDPAEPEHRGW